jgi:hypothetical protein
MLRTLTDWRCIYVAMNYPSVRELCYPNQIYSVPLFEAAELPRSRPEQLLGTSQLPILEFHSIL